MSIEIVKEFFEGMKIHHITVEDFDGPIRYVDPVRVVERITSFKAELAEARKLIDGCAEEINYLMQMGWIRFGEKAPQGAVKILAKIEEFRKR